MIKKGPRVLVAAILFVLGVATLTPCPDVCTCRFKATTCRNAHLTSTPRDISKDTTNLNVSHNSIATLNKTDLIGLLNLTIISMNDNVIETIDPETFHPLKKLRRLYLNNNHITQLHYQTFRWAKTLRYLFLQNNRIGYMDPGLFDHVMKLKVLDISRNYLKTLEPRTFQNNRALSLINIRNNLCIDVIDWKPILNHSFNFLDIQFCEEKNYVFNIYKDASKHQRGNEGSPHISDNLNKDNRTLVSDKDLITRYLFIKPNNASFEEYDTFIRTVGYDEYSTIIARENYYTTLLTDYPIFCYCKGQFLWFWCHEIEAKCSNNSSVLIMITASKCSSEVSSKSSLPPISEVPDSEITRYVKTFGIINRNGGTTINTVKSIIYTWIGVGILIIWIT